MSIFPNCIHDYSLHELHTFHTHEALVMFILKEGSHNVLNCFIPTSDGSHNGKRILSTRLFAYCFFTSVILHKKKMTMVLVEVLGIACYLPSSLVQNVVQFFVKWERGGKKKKVKLVTRQFGKDHSLTFLSHSTALHTYVQSAPKLVHNK